ncbi:MAG: 3-keto-5-aminohexanoate cleavage protein, partial [Deltaproteobacteria bacterium]|nr:3-keto-5-aminohexanoate cleavage protein [Deltaproteobacteria bacterium]
PLHMQFVMGVLGAIRGTPEDLTYLATRAKILFGEENFTWSVIGVGAAEINLSTMAIHMGGHVRVGLEDNIYLKKGVLAKSNAQLVEKIVHLAEVLDRPVATPEDTRRILRLKGKDKVNF